MKNIDLREFRGKDILVLLKKADELFIGNLEEKIHSHKIYNNLLEQIPIDYENIKLEHDYLSSAEKLLKFQNLYFDTELIKKDIKDIKIIKKKLNKLEVQQLELINNK